MNRNYLLQILTMIAMEPPSSVGADSLRNRKVDTLKAIHRWTPEEEVQIVVSAQYKNYLCEPNITSNITTLLYV